MPDPTTKGSTPGPDHYRRQLVGELRRPVYDGSLPVGHDNRKLELEELFGDSSTALDSGQRSSNVIATGFRDGATAGWSRPELVEGARERHARMGPPRGLITEANAAHPPRD